LMGGRIWVVSQVGKGSTFLFTANLSVQADQSQRQAAPVSQCPNASVAFLKGLRILLADDSEDNRFLILSYLNDAGCQIEIAENGEIAWSLFQPGRYDLVLMDIEMPVMDGYAATRAIRLIEQQANAAATPVLALTAHAFADIVGKSQEAGFTAHLTKPVRKTALIDAIAQYTHAGSSRVAALPPPAHEAVAPAVAPSAAAAGARIKVRMEPGMEDIVPAYLAKRKKEIAQYRQALENQDFETIRMLGHKLKGTGAGYGFAELTSLGSALEQAALRRDSSDVRTKVDELANYVDNLELEYPE